MLPDSQKGEEQGEEYEVRVVLVESVDITPVPWLQHRRSEGGSGHLVLVVGGDDLYHLVFTQDRAGRFTGVSLQWSSTEGLTLRDLGRVGRTRLSNRQIRMAGHMLINLFGSYHMVFWNCDKFLQCFLHIMCQGQAQQGSLPLCMDQGSLSIELFALSPVREPVATRTTTKGDLCGVEIQSDDTIRSVLPVAADHDDISSSHTRPGETAGVCLLS
jgi:hypothetical protein